MVRGKSMHVQNSYAWSQRMLQMLIGWGTVGVVYFGLGWRDTPASIVPELWLDRQLPFNANGVWLYLAFFLFVPFTFIAVHSERLVRLRYAMQISALICGAFFILLPTQLNYPALTGQGISLQLVTWLVAYDSPQNCFPSLHGALSLICVMALWQRQRLVMSALVVGFGLAIAVSIIQLRRHLVIDLCAGIVVGCVAYAMATRLESVSKGWQRGIV